MRNILTIPQPVKERYIIINDKGELLAFKLTPANTDDRTPVPEMTREIWGKLFGDKGYSAPIQVVEYSSTNEVFQN